MRLDWRGIMSGITVAGVLALAAGALHARDRIASLEAADRQQEAVRVPERKAEEQWRDEVRESLRAIKGRLGIL